MNVTFSPRSLQQIEQIHIFLAERNPEAARDVVSRIQALCEGLGDFPGIGTVTDQPNVRMLPVIRYPYVIFYSIFEIRNEVRILRVRHTSRMAKLSSRDT